MSPLENLCENVFKTAFPKNENLETVRGNWLRTINKSHTGENYLVKGRVNQSVKCAV